VCHINGCTNSTMVRVSADTDAESTDSDTGEDTLYNVHSGNTSSLAWPAFPSIAIPLTRIRPMFTRAIDNGEETPLDYSAGSVVSGIWDTEQIATVSKELTRETVDIASKSPFHSLWTHAAGSFCVKAYRFSWQMRWIECGAVRSFNTWGVMCPVQAHVSVSMDDDATWTSPVLVDGALPHTGGRILCGPMVALVLGPKGGHLSIGGAANQRGPARVVPGDLLHIPVDVVSGLQVEGTAGVGLLYCCYSSA
jgi:hypothetical protein